MTGAAGGIGMAASTALTQFGANIVATDIVSLDLVNERLSEFENNFSTFKCDITSEKDVTDLVNFTISKYGKVDILVHCSGILKTTSIEETTLEDWEKVLKVNLTGTFLICKAVFPHMKSQNYGKIVCLGSVAGKQGGISSGPHYVASKGGVHSLVKGLALSGAQYGIYANAIALGPVTTDMTKGVTYNKDSFPLKRLGEPEDIVGAILYLVSDSSNWVTGEVLDVNGGMRM